MEKYTEDILSLSNSHHNTTELEAVYGIMEYCQNVLLRQGLLLSLSVSLYLLISFSLVQYTLLLHVSFHTQEYFFSTVIQCVCAVI